LYRESCIPKEGRYIKDLRIIKNRNLKDIVIVDNSIISFSCNINNGIHVPSYFGQCDDDCLLHIINLLRKITDCNNVQEELEKILGLKKLFEEFIEMQDDITN
jgi:TFIIF-interacting CTD phosphatase-like protein